MSNTILIIKAIEKALGALLNRVKGMFARHRASVAAIEGADLAYQGSLDSLVAKELATLANTSGLPLELQSSEFRTWLKHPKIRSPFTRALLGRVGNLPSLERSAHDELAEEYERITGETRKLAAGRVALTVAHIYGQLWATESGRQALSGALLQAVAARVYGLAHPELVSLPTDADLNRVRAMASQLLDAGKSSWKTPSFVAPLSLEVPDEQKSEDPCPTSLSELLSGVNSGHSFVLFGEGGIGKTTILLELSSACLDGKRRRIPIYVDAAMWARSSVNFLDYVAATPAARLHSVTSADLTILAESGYLAIMVNGWNEVSESQKLVCREMFNHLTTTADALSVVAVSRTRNDVPNLASAKRVEVRGLAWHGQSAVIRAELASETATALLEMLAKNSRLRHAARSPLVLRGIIARAKRGNVTSSSVYDLLGAVVQAFEEDAQRKLVLKDAPVLGKQSHFLEEIACQFTWQLETSLSRDDVLPAISTVAEQLVKRGLLGTIPHPDTVLDVLSSHHLLHLEDGIVRFAHQRFLEYYAATRILRECIEGTKSPGLLRVAVNQPAWGASLALVAEKLKGDDGLAAARVHLVTTAAKVDLGLACDLAGLSSFGEADCPALYHQLVASVSVLTDSPLGEVRDLGVACQIASGFTVFSDKLWSILESDNKQTRLHTQRLNGSGISIAQLGDGAEARIATWPSERRQECVHEFADNPDNYDFLVRLANTEPTPAVRAAAIAALSWNFPASDAAIQAWLNAPLEVQTEPNVVSLIEDALEQGQGGEEVRERLSAIAGADISENAQLRLALAFPNEVGSRTLDAIFTRLRTAERHRNDTQLVSVAAAKAPERLLELAQDLALNLRVVPEWVSELLGRASPDIKAGVFERVWNLLQAGELANLDHETLGPLANRSQIVRSITTWLQYCKDRRVNMTDAEQERGRHLGYLLAHSPGSDLLGVVSELGRSASYEQATALVELVLTRIGREDGRVPETNQWLPTVAEVRQLIALFGEKIEAERVPQDKVFVCLCCIASHVSPSEFGALLLDGCRRHLDAWTAYQEVLNDWLKTPSAPRPSNPHLSLYLTSALARWGPDAIPGLLAMMTHPSAMSFIPEAIGRIVCLPWASRKDWLLSSVVTDIQEGVQRREAGRAQLQPDDRYQQVTNDAARALGNKLTELLDRLYEERAKDAKWNWRQARYRLGSLLGIVANIPSSEITIPVDRALASDFTDIFSIVSSLRGLVRQGMFISDIDVVRQLEAKYEEEASRTWLDDSSRFAMGEFSQLMYCVQPPELLSKPLSHYLEQWQRFSHTNEIIRCLGRMPFVAAWTSLLAIGKELAARGKLPEDIVFELAAALTPAHFDEFLGLVTDGTLFAWCRSAWNLERISSNVAAVIGEDVERLDAFLNACRAASSPLADALAGAVLSNVKGSDVLGLRQVLDAVDAGRAALPNMPAYRTLMDMFKLRVSTGIEGQYQIYPRACNELRTQLYIRADKSGPIADGCRRLLAEIECERRESGRPLGELRHPLPDEDNDWTGVLAITS